MKYQKVEGENNLIRETGSKAILSTDNKSLAEYKLARALRHEEKNKIIQCQKDINTLNEDIKDIKESLNLIIKKLSGN